ncbi:hypothetical protein OROMI_034981 [Orobanche minor]
MSRWLVDYNVFTNGASSIFNELPKCSRPVVSDHTIRCHSKRPLGIFGEYKLSRNPISQEVENFLVNAISLNFFERLNLAWKIIFPSPATKGIPMQTLPNNKIVTKVVSALSDFVEIESQDRVQLSVSTDPDIGTIYSVTVPVRRVRSEYQVDDESGSITNIEYKDTGETSGSVDVKFDFYIPGDKC